jgi:hypothetical protein
MKKMIKIIPVLTVMVILSCQTGYSQTANDAIMMNKGQFCNGISYSYSSWTQYWEGTYKRSNENIGTFSSQALMYMPNYGISDKLNVMANVPYVWNHVTAGTLHDLSGFQDISVDVKWKAYSTKLGTGKFSVFLVGGFSTPLSNYVVDYLPLSIGLGTTNLLGRVILHYKLDKFFVRGSAAYVWRSNTYLDRTAYYTTSMHLTNEVEMPDQMNFNGSLGYQYKYLIAEAEIENVTTLGGFDIRKNDMPFPSNKMNATDLVAHVKYTLPFDTHIQLDGMFGYTIAGRNVGQATSFMIGAYYVFSFAQHQQPKQTSSSKQ